MNRDKRIVAPALLVTVALSFTSVGCGRDGPQRYSVSGAITYGGQPVSAGRVIFEPDTDKGNHGPAAYAEIVDGEYETTYGRGTIGGPQRVRAIILNGDKSNSELPQGSMMCPEFRTEIDLPREDSRQNLEVPGSLTW